MRRMLVSSPFRASPTSWRRPLAVIAISSIAAVSWFALGKATPAKLVELSSEPLYASTGAGKPTLSLALSVKFPTVGAQYLNGNYSPTDEYIGYFDAESCYAYVNDSDAMRRRFDRTGAATSRGCAGAGFSGNFLNWATSSAVDVLHLGLTGGDRIVDEPDMTILQRAVLDAPRDGNFARKKLTAAAAAGAVPTALRGDWTGDIWISNCLNRVEFGTGTSAVAPIRERTRILA